MAAAKPPIVHRTAPSIYMAQHVNSVAVEKSALYVSFVGTS